MRVKQTDYWTQEDFQVFTVEGLENRMHALQTIVQPKFHELGEYFATKLSAECGEEFFSHVAKHARRTVNPPNDSWVAMAPSKRGYKALPHFQIGLWSSHVFIVIAVIYENPDKKGIAERLTEHQQALFALPDDFVISGDHMKPEADNIHDVGKDGVEKTLTRLQDVKKAECLIGRHLSKAEAVKMTKEEFMNYAEETFNALLPIYNIIINKSAYYASNQ